MTGNGTADEIARINGRLDVLEREVEGEKTVTRYILEQTRRNGDDIAELKTRVGRVEQKLDRHIDAFERFRDEFPSQVAGVMRDVLREPRS